MNEKERQIFQRLKDNYQHFASRSLKIRSTGGDIKPFVFNKAQLYVNQQVEQQRALMGKVRAIIVKGRQQGMSTYIGGRFYWKTCHHYGHRAFILTHEFDATDNLFEMVNRYHEHCHPELKPQTGVANAKELNFSILDSGFKLGTAGNKAVGRSQTIQLLHGSEVAYWQNAAEHAKGIMQAVPNDKGTEIFLESTANGLGNYFHQQWQKAEAGESDFIPIFVPWYWEDRYNRICPEDFKLTDEEDDLKAFYGLTNEQLNWRRYKIVELSVTGADGKKAFQQEYPMTSTEAFQTSGENCYILPDQVMAARKCTVEGVGLKLLGVDPARFGDDRTSLIWRQGRKSYGLVSYKKKDTMEVAGIVHRAIVEGMPDKVFIDTVGLGAGVYDRLCELGHIDILVSVSSGSSPLDANKFINRRAEMWFNMREWILEQPAQLPDSDSLHADLCAPLYSFDSKDRLKIEKKEDLKKRGLRSPDEAEALLMTFYYPASALLESSKRKDAEIARTMMSGYNEQQRLRQLAFTKRK